MVKIHLQHKSFLLTSFLIFFLSLTTTADKTEAEALVKWKSTLYNPVSLSSWSLTNFTGPCKWFGVRCNPAGNITNLNLTEFSINGTLFGLDFSLFHNLASLTLSNIEFYGPIPSTIQSLSNLKHLDLSWNSFNGPLPTEIGKLSKLSLSGELPRDISHGFALENFSVRNNHFTGFLPKCLRNCTMLETIYLANNHFFGDIYKSLQAHPYLEYVDLTGLNLSGTLEFWTRFPKT
ncbi:hypothetical protein LUZ60_011439 [Juncus effusus]|nr:hypothetical protein LUZ60_011439 [Juncus effusus]